MVLGCQNGRQGLALLILFALASLPATAEEAPGTKPALTSSATAAIADKKSDVLKRIGALQAAGVGVGPYEQQVKAIDELANFGAPQEQVLKRYESLSSAIEDQSSRMKALKNYHPAPVSHPLDSGNHNSSMTALMASVKGKFGGKLPGGITSDDLQSFLKNNPNAKPLLDKLR